MRHFLILLLSASLPLIAQHKIEPDMPSLYSKILNDADLPTPALSRLLFLLGIPHQENLYQIVSTTQNKWIQTGKERWEFEHLEEDKRDLLIPLFKSIGLYDGILAQCQEYDYALVYGGFYSRVLKRIEDLVSEYERGVRFKKVVLLTGQRFLDPLTTEGTLGLETETEMMFFVWQNSHMPEEMRNLPIQVIDTPRQLTVQGTWTRPTTKDTLIEWLATKPAAGTCLFISSQPFVGYQDSVARTFLPADFSIETIGTSSDENLPISVHLDNLARWLYQERIRRRL